MSGLLNAIGEWFRELFVGGIISNFTSMFDEVNTKVGEIASDVGQTPLGWNAPVYNMIKTLSETVIIPVAGMILTFVLCYELITMITEKNNMAEFDTFNLFKWFFKTFVAAYILTHTFDIVMGVFTVAQWAVNKSAGVIGSRLDIVMAMADLEAQLAAMGIGELIGLYLESAILGLAMKAISLCVFIIIYGRMIEIYLTCSLAPIPLATMVNHEWGSMGNNYLKSLFALAFQGFLIMVCVAIYAILLQSVTSSSNIHTAVWGCAGYSVLLCLTLFRSSNLAKGILGAH